MKDNNHFELQLIVIGILIPLYLQVLPSLLKPINDLFYLSFEIVRFVFYIMGLMWFICLLFGTYSLINKPELFSEKSHRIYLSFFGFNNVTTLVIFAILFVAYLTNVISFFIRPFIMAYPGIAIPIIVILFICLALFILYLLWSLKNKLSNREEKKDGKKRKK